MSEYGILHESFKGRCSPVTQDRVYLYLYHDPEVGVYNIVLQSADKVEALTGFTYAQAQDKFNKLIRWWR